MGGVTPAGAAQSTATGAEPQAAPVRLNLSTPITVDMRADGTGTARLNLKPEDLPPGLAANGSRWVLQPPLVSAPTELKPAQVAGQLHLMLGQVNPGSLGKVPVMIDVTAPGQPTRPLLIEAPQVRNDTYVRTGHLREEVATMQRVVENGAKQIEELQTARQTGVLPDWAAKANLVPTDLDGAIDLSRLDEVIHRMQRAQSADSARLWAVAVWQCPCGGRRKVTSIVSSRSTAEQMLRNMGLLPPSPPLPVAQAPPPLAKLCANGRTRAAVSSRGARRRGSGAGRAAPRSPRRRAPGRRRWARVAHQR